MLRLLDEMQHSLELIADLRPLATEALGKKHREPRGIHGENPTNDGCIDTLRSRGHQRMTFLSQRTGDQFDQMNRHDRNMATAKNGNPPFSLVLEQGQFLSEGVDPVQCRKIKGLAQ